MDSSDPFSLCSPNLAKIIVFLTVTADKGGLPQVWGRFTTCEAIYCSELVVDSCFSVVVVVVVVVVVAVVV